MVIKNLIDKQYIKDKKKINLKQNMHTIVIVIAT